jgi:hypothetical protein
VTATKGDYCLTVKTTTEEVKWVLERVNLRVNDYRDNAIIEGEGGKEGKTGRRRKKKGGRNENLEEDEEVSRLKESRTNIHANGHVVINKTFSPS